MADNDGLIPFIAYPNSKSEAYIYGAHISSVPAGWACGRHLHHRMLEVNVVLEGTQAADIGGTRLWQQAGELIVVPPMRLHTFSAATALRYFVFHVQIDDSPLLRRLGDAGALLLSRGDKATPELLRATEALRKQLAAGGSKLAVYRLVYEILELVETEILAASGADAAESDALPALIAREIEAIVSRPDAEDESDPQPPLRDNWLEEISARLGYSRRHCRRAFAEAYRMSPREYLFVLRQQEAMHLLATTRLTVEEIGFRLGYDNVQSFIRQFSKWTGTTPGRFRKERGGELSYLTPIERG